MPEERPRFLLGQGHRLTSEVRIVKDFDEPEPPYTLDEAKARVGPMVTRAAADLNALPAAACPEDYAVGRLTIHPQYTAKSYFPIRLLREAGLESIGSRPTTVVPDKLRNKQRGTAPLETVELLVSGRRRDLLRWSAQLPYWDEGTRGANQLFEVEQFAAMLAPDRIRVPETDELAGRKGQELILEVVLHTAGQLSPDDVLASFLEFANEAGAEADLTRRFDVGGLTFFPIRVARHAIGTLSNFAFLRVIRGLPELRPIDTITRGLAPKHIACHLPTGGAVDPTLRVAVFDGGILNVAPLKEFVTLHLPPGIAKPVRSFQQHGQQVTSALLFGNIPDSGDLPRPYALVDVYCVLDENSHKNPTELYDVLARIRDVLQSRRYQFVNISIGPKIALIDSDVHPWTAVLDDLLSDSNTFATVAVGNEGLKDWASGNARVQVPADSVNAVAVGACSSLGDGWARADYSCIGYGRSPGRIKPDVLAFGGTPSEPFSVLNDTCSRAVPTVGTSFASPLALRQAVGIRAHFGDLLTPLSIKALMVHCSECMDGHDRREVGWGRIPNEIDGFVVCPDGLVRVVYQDELTAAQWVRAQVPLPKNLPNVRVEICATFCIASATDPQDPSNYTRSGLDIVWRPHAGRKGKDGGYHPATDSFFRQSDYDAEHELRTNAHKWETVLHATRRYNANSLSDPAFDIHYQTRIAGKPTRAGDRIKYSLIVTLRAPKIADLYDQVVQRYQTILEPIQPRIDIPIRVTGG